MSKTKSSLLQTVISNLVRAAAPQQGSIGDPKEWLGNQGIVHGWINPGTRVAEGFNREGARAIGMLAAELQKERKDYHRAVTFDKFCEAVASMARSTAAARPVRGDAIQDLALFETDLAAWFTAETVKRKFLIPCAIIPDRASAFTIGPVSFFHVEEFLTRERLHAANALDDISYGSVLRSMSERSATWMAEIEIDGCLEARGAAIADLAVDVALVAVQMAIPVEYSKDMARITGRTNPPWVGSVYNSASTIKSSIRRQDPGYGFSGGAFDQLLTQQRALLDSVGRRVDAYVQNAAPLLDLALAWCDGAYWFHEGLAERLDTIAVAKLETALEVLLGAESSKGSSKRLREAFRSFYGREESQPIRPGSTVTVKEFITSIVGARSRVLHGTFSTLAPNQPLPRASVQELAWDLLRRSTMMLDVYQVASSAADDTASFLEWVRIEREKAEKAASGQVAP